LEIVDQTVLAVVGDARRRAQREGTVGISLGWRGCEPLIAYRVVVGEECGHRHLRRGQVVHDVRDVRNRHRPIRLAGPADLGVVEGESLVQARGVGGRISGIGILRRTRPGTHYLLRHIEEGLAGVDERNGGWRIRGAAAADLRRCSLICDRDRLARAVRIGVRLTARQTVEITLTSRRRLIGELIARAVEPAEDIIIRPVLEHYDDDVFDGHALSLFLRLISLTYSHNACLVRGICGSLIRSNGAGKLGSHSRCRMVRASALFPSELPFEPV
jgi:hypothetical protein